MSTVIKTGIFTVSDISEYKEFLTNSLLHITPNELIVVLSIMLDSKLTPSAQHVIRCVGEVSKRLYDSDVSHLNVRLILNELSVVADNVIENYGVDDFTRIKTCLKRNGNVRSIQFKVFEYSNCLKIEEFRQFLDNLEKEGEYIDSGIYKLINRFIDSGLINL